MSAVQVPDFCLGSGCRLISDNFIVTGSIVVFDIEESVVVVVHWTQGKGSRVECERLL